MHPVNDLTSGGAADELGIEFMESGDTYQRQVLSIFSIASGICLLGVACMALYRRNKRHREKLQAHFSDSRSLRECSVNASGLMSKSTPRIQYSLHLQKGCSSHGPSFKGNVVAPGSSTVTPPVLSKALSKGKCFRSSSLSLSPAQHRREVSHFRTPPISRGKHKISTSLIDSSRVAGHVYRHLQEDESTDMEPIKRCDSARTSVGTLTTRTSLTSPSARKGWTEVPCTRLDKGTPFLPHSMRTRSVPIIPSLQACDPEAKPARTNDQNQTGLLKWCPALSGELSKPTSNPPPQHGNFLLKTEISACSTTPFANTCALLGSEKNVTKASFSVEFATEIVQDLKQKSFSSQEKMSGPHSECHHGGTNTLKAEAEMVQQSEGKGIQYLAGAVHTASATRSVKVEGQREVQGQCQGQTSPSHRRANSFLATKGLSCRGTGNTYAKPSAS
ncbi:PREDICTED: pro-neuregulin-3, membrane-bound isoform-like [Cyprinodon variegatus]|uniref:pro-neuregulin-3, membrane-bound isoform-like n=1 Tax=Cyprinodon variegatus TaxID=28743 RepID=UPI0007425E50|nr:PREDICTED: pro-neuregulin-3, membrane-bound isoform-like [Cyprinodon variegatus]